MFGDPDQEQLKFEDRHKEKITSKIGDPFAQQIKWTPLKRGGTNIRTHKLYRANPNRIEFKASVGARLFYLSFLVIGCGILICLPYFTISYKGFALNNTTIIPILVASVFIIVGTCLYYFCTTPIVFDKKSGFVWKGRNKREDIINKNNLKHFFELRAIHALQLISEYIKSDRKAYYSYELNIVLNDGRRINIVDHSEKEPIEREAKKLSNFLGKAVWKSYD